MKNNKLFLGLGSNLGNRKENLLLAQRFIQEKIGEIRAKSSIYETTAWGMVDQNKFLNQALEVETNFSPSIVLGLVLKIETEMGRIRAEKWGKRSIDIDILYFDKEIINTKYLVIPHPFIQERKFVLVSLCEIADNFIHPKLKETNFELLKKCEDLGEVDFFYG